MISFDKPYITRDEALGALDRAAAIVRQNLPMFAGHCQNHSSIGNLYPLCDNDQWTCGFWPGEIWLAYEHTGDMVFKQEALTLVDSFAERIERHIMVDHHDMGFLYSPSCVAAYRLTGNKKGRQAAILAADRLLARFQPKGGFLQAWGAMGAPENYRFIIDCLLNLPLLYWASDVTGNSRYCEVARLHTATCLKHSIRSDGSTYHTFFMDSVTGAPSHGATCQGYRDDSVWARGQAWGVYGTALSYSYTGSPEALSAFSRVLEFYLKRLPDDLVPYWDMIFDNSSDEPRDSSSASIVACGLLEAAKHQPQHAEYYRALASQMLKSLVDRYAVADGPVGTGLVHHATYSKKSPFNTCTPEGVDECVSWGDYFYMEALTRFVKDWEMYW